PARRFWQLLWALLWVAAAGERQIQSKKSNRHDRSAPGGTGHCFGAESFVPLCVLSAFVAAL
ncbi:MAG: hypothetical protein KDE01_05915, partial [Caldilineaceae bacterium]|nr:hypothetical protein [Caldilineaceae bacterium]